MRRLSSPTPYLTFQKPSSSVKLLSCGCICLNSCLCPFVRAYVHSKVHREEKQPLGCFESRGLYGVVAWPHLVMFIPHDTMFAHCWHGSVELSLWSLGVQCCSLSPNPWRMCPHPLARRPRPAKYPAIHFDINQNI